MKAKHAARSEGADRALASHIQHRPPAQLTGLPGPGARGEPALFVRFGYASANEQGWSVDNTNLNLESGSIPGGSSVEQNGFPIRLKFKHIPEELIELERHRISHPVNDDLAVATLKGAA